MHGQLSGFGEAHDAGYVFGSGALAALVAATHQQGFNGGPAAHKHGADALGAMHFVSADGAEMAAEAADIKFNFARALHRVNVEEDAGVGGDFADFFNGLEHAGLVVGQHHADEPRLGPNGAKNIRGVDEATGLGRYKGCLHAMLRHAIGCLQNRGVLNRSGNEMIAGMQQAEDGCVVAFGAAGVEDHFCVVAVEKFGHDGARAVHGGVRLLAVEVNRGGVAEMLHPVWPHGLHHLRQQRCSGIGIHIDSLHRSISFYRLYGITGYRCFGRCGQRAIPTAGLSGFGVGLVKFLHAAQSAGGKSDAETSLYCRLHSRL